LDDWMLPRVTDYWDQQVEAIERLSRVLAETPEAERPAQVELIQRAVTRHLQALEDEWLTKVAYIAPEDLYKAASVASRLDDPLFQYLSATGGPLFHRLTERGYTVEYFVDNSYERLDGPAIGFPLWFRAAGLAYICPQEIAVSSFEKDRPRQEWPALVTRYSADARAVAQELVERCHREGRHFVHLDIDSDGLPAGLSHSGEPGVISIFRNDAPVAGSKCVVKMPPGPRMVAQSQSAPPAAASAAGGGPASPAPPADPASDSPGLFKGLRSLFSGKRGN
jgi:hypothetical protein